MVVALQAGKATGIKRRIGACIARWNEGSAVVRPSLHCPFCVIFGGNMMDDRMVSLEFSFSLHHVNSRKTRRDWHFGSAFLASSVCGVGGDNDVADGADVLSLSVSQ